MSESLREKAKRHPQIVNRLLVVIALLSLGTLVVVSAVFQTRQAETNSAATQVALANAALERERAETHSIALAAQARQLFNDGQGSLALALALEAAQLDNPPIEVHNILADILYAPGIKEWHPYTDIFPVISPDGSTLSYIVDNELIIMDVASWSELRRVNLVGLMPAGTISQRLSVQRLTGEHVFIINFYDEKSLTTVLELATGRKSYEFTGHFVLANDGEQMLRYQPNVPQQHAELWDVSTGQVIKVLPNLPLITRYTGVVFSEDNRYLYLYDTDRLMVYDVVDDTLRSADVPIVKQPLTLLPYTTTDAHPYILLGDQEIAYFWDVETLTRTAAVSASSDIRLSSYFIALSPNHRFVFGSNKNNLYLQYLEAPDTLYEEFSLPEIRTWNPTALIAPDDPYWRSDVVFSPDSQRLYGVTAQGLVVWDVSRSDEAPPLQLPSLHNPVVFRYSQDVIYLMDTPNRQSDFHYPDLYRLNAPDWQVTYQYHDLDSYVLSLDGKLLLVGRRAPHMTVTDVTVLDATTNAILAKWEAAGYIADISPDNQFVLMTGSYEQGLSVQAVMTGQLLYTVANDPTNMLGALLGEQGSLWLWHYSTDINHHVTQYNAVGDAVREYIEIDYDSSARTLHLQADDGEIVYLNLDTAQTSSEPPEQPRLKILAEDRGSFRLVDTQQNRTLAQWKTEFMFTRQEPRISEDGTMMYGVLDNELVFWRIHTTEELIQLAHETRYIPELTCEQRELYHLAPCEGEPAKP